MFLEFIVVVVVVDVAAVAVLGVIVVVAVVFLFVVVVVVVKIAVVVVIVCVCLMVSVPSSSELVCKRASSAPHLASSSNLWTLLTRLYTGSFITETMPMENRLGSAQTTWLL